MFRKVSGALLLLLSVIILIWGMSISLSSPSPDDREEVVFWHFWSGPDGEVVDDVIRRFNQSQDLYYVRGVSMPGRWCAPVRRAPPSLRLLSRPRALTSEWRSL